MFGPLNFEDCVRQQLKDKGFGQKRGDEIMKRLKGLQSHFEAGGARKADAQFMALSRLMAELADEVKERAKRTLAQIDAHARLSNMVAQGETVPVGKLLLEGKWGSTKGVGLARGAIASIEADPRFSGISYATNKEVIRGQLFAIMGDVLDKIGRGMYGVQRGKAHLPNIVRELFGEATGDSVAASIAKAYTKTQEVGVRLFNQAGGSLKALKDFRLPQAQSAARLIRYGREAWITDTMQWLDWSKMRWPDGSPIDPADHRRVLEYAYDTLATGGANKISGAMRGQGGAVGNKLKEHRFLVYKDAPSWLAMHEKYGEGNVAEVLFQHIEHMSHETALVQTFGPNPETARQNLHNIVRRRAAAYGGQAVAEADAVLKNRFDPMFDVITQQNAMDPHSVLGNLVVGTSNILSSALLGSASFLAIPGDFMQSLAVRALNKMDLFGGVGWYMKTILTDRKFAQQIAAQSGFVMDQTVMSTYAAARFNGVSEVGPAFSRRVSDAVLRSTLLAGHTNAARWANQAEFMGLMARSRNMAFDDVPFVDVMRRYGITSDMWDTFRAIQVNSPATGVEFLRPIDVLNSGAGNAQALYRAFQGMIFEEARKMVPETTVEGTVFLKNTNRPDTLPGAILSSFAMYKNFPVSFQMIYGRLGMMAPSIMGSKNVGRLAFYAGLGAGMTLVGALGTQMREVSKGRDPLPMDNVAFLGKAFLSGGALSIWGDFLFAGVNEYGRGPEAAIAGPLAAMGGDLTDLALGEVFQWADMLGGLGDSKEVNTAAKAVEFARRYTPGTSIWWARLALERQVWDRLQELADPRAYKNRQRKIRKQREQFGNDYWWAPGEREAARAPRF